MDTTEHCVGKNNTKTSANQNLGVVKTRDYKDGSNQRLKREEAKDKNHDKKAMAADI